MHNVLIEYDGIEAHATKEAKARDRIKNKFAKENGIKLYRISGYWHIDHLINDRLKLKKNEALRPKILKSEFNEKLHASKKKQIGKGLYKKKMEARKAKRKKS